VDLHTHEEFKRWWEEDWSWEGLAAKTFFEDFERTVDGGTLQSHWRREAAALVEFGGRKWTRFHVPSYDLSGNPFHGFADAKGEIYEDLCRKIERPGNPQSKLAGCINLQGVVLPDLPGSSRPLTGDFSSAIFLDSIEMPMKLKTRFDHAIFLCGINFDERIFLPGSSFARAKFAESASLASARFDASVSFEQCVFAGSVDFDNAQFHGAADFGRSEFLASCSMEAASFAAGLRLAGARFSEANLKVVKIERNLDARECRFDAVDFSGSRFFGYAVFGTSHVEDADFSSVEFGREASFDGAHIGHGIFSKARFADRATFYDLVAETASFDGAEFVKDLTMNSARFYHSLNLDNIRASGHVGLSGLSVERFGCRSATFAGDLEAAQGKYGRADFRATIFEGEVEFRDALFEDGVSYRGVAFRDRASFAGCRFRQNADFFNCTFAEKTIFANAQFDGVLELYGANLHPDTSFAGADFGDGTRRPPSNLFESRLRVPLPAALAGSANIAIYRYREFAYWLRTLPFLFSLRWPAMRELRRWRNEILEQRENAFRDLRKQCEEAGAAPYESDFHAWELRMHRARTNVSPTDRVAGFFYGLFSDFGRSMGRPLLILAISWGAFFALNETALAPPYRSDGPGILAAACRSVTRMPDAAHVLADTAHGFIPSLYGASSPGSRPDWAKCAEGDHPLLVFFASTAQLLVFLICVTLMVVALRRKFRIRS
jgi:uncharacterized protein YjbI with pentapeptide repeats